MQSRRRCGKAERSPQRAGPVPVPMWHGPVAAGRAEGVGPAGLTAVRERALCGGAQRHITFDALMLASQSHDVRASTWALAHVHPIPLSMVPLSMVPLSKVPLSMTSARPPGRALTCTLTAQASPPALEPLQRCAQWLAELSGRRPSYAHGSTQGGPRKHSRAHLSASLGTWAPTERSGRAAAAQTGRWAGGTRPEACAAVRNA